MARSADQPPKRNTGGTKKVNTGSTSYSTTTGRDSRATEDEWPLDAEFDSEPPRSNTTAIRRTNLPVPRPPTAGLPRSASPIPPRRTGQGQARPSTSLNDPITIRPSTRGTTKPQQPPKKNIFSGKVHWLLPVGIGMIAMLVLWEVGSLALAWGLARADDLRYGVPRTYQTNAVVGHGGDSAQHPSHFIAINLNRQAIVVEFPAGSQVGALSYVVPYYILGPGGDLTPITLEFRDVTGDGKPDMIIHIHLQAQDQTFVFVNDGTKFRPPNAKDNIHL